MRVSTPWAWLPTVIAFLSLSSITWCTPIGPGLKPHLVENLPSIKARQAVFSVTGVSDGGPVHPRLEIRQLQQNPDQWNVYLLGLERFQNMDQSDMLSWYQIAGIHGRPFVPWDGVQAVADPPSSGYCTHQSNLFPTWHRPYLALFEQILHANVIDAVNEFPPGPVHDKYAAAASTFRMPYWDWAAAPPQGQSVLPTSLSSPTVQIVKPNGTVTIDNPLFAYRFHPLVPSDINWFPLTQWSQTLRSPSSMDATAQSRNDQVASTLDAQRTMLRDRLYILLTQYSQYSNFSNEAWMPAGSNWWQYDNIESVHDSVHAWVGGANYGHMAVIDNSAFDPIFWLHHTMVDRIFAIWQTLYPNSWVEPMAQVTSTFTYQAGTVESSNSPLTPFHSDANGDFWTSDSARAVTSFGYTYPELVGGDINSVKSAINTLYGSQSTGATKTSRSTKKKNPRTRPENTLTSRSRPHELRGSHEVAKESPAQTSPNPSNDTGVAVGSRQYLVNVRAQRHALKGSYFIHIFLGDFNSNPTCWPFDPNLVGTNVMLSNQGIVEGPGYMSTGAVPLATALQARVQQGKLSSLDDVVVEAYLKKNLHWRVATLDGQEVPRDEVPGLQMSVVSTAVELAQSPSDFPKFIGGVVTHTDVTDGRPGGLCSADV